jgi:hypothetical protein
MPPGWTCARRSRSRRWIVSLAGWPSRPKAAATMSNCNCNWPGCGPHACVPAWSSPCNGTRPILPRHRRSGRRPTQLSCTVACNSGRLSNAPPRRTLSGDAAAVSENLPRAIGHLQSARSLCPLLPEIHLLLAELTVLADEDADNRADLRRVRLTAPGQPAILTRCGLLELQAGRIELACQSWKNSLALAPDQFAEILRVARPSIDLAKHISRLVPIRPHGYWTWPSATSAPKPIGRSVAPC